MTKLLDKAFETAKHLPSERQDEVASLVLHYVEVEADDLSPEELRDLEETLAEVERGEFATAEEVAAAFRAFEGKK